MCDRRARSVMAVLCPMGFSSTKRRIGDGGEQARRRRRPAAPRRRRGRWWTAPPRPPRTGRRRSGPRRGPAPAPGRRRSSPSAPVVSTGVTGGGRLQQRCAVRRHHQRPAGAQRHDDRAGGRPSAPARPAPRAAARPTPASWRARARWAPGRRRTPAAPRQRLRAGAGVKTTVPVAACAAGEHRLQRHLAAGGAAHRPLHRVDGDVLRREHGIRARHDDDQVLAAAVLDRDGRAAGRHPGVRCTRLTFTRGVGQRRELPVAGGVLAHPAHHVHARPDARPPRPGSAPFLRPARAWRPADDGLASRPGSRSTPTSTSSFRLPTTVTDTGDLRVAAGDRDHGATCRRSAR